MNNNDVYKVENFQVIHGDCNVYSNQNLKNACEKGKTETFSCFGLPEDELKACLCGYNQNYCPK